MESSAANRNRALVCVGTASMVLISGVAAAMAQFPDGFDWMYTVLSKLGSRTHNPAGAPWLAASLLAAIALLWPVTSHLGRGLPRGHYPPPLSVVALRTGLIGGALLAVEGSSSLDLSRLGRKGHEIVALVTFLGLYGGVMGFYVRRIRESPSFLPPALLVILPLCAVGVTQLVLYLDQRDLGWVGTAWREMGVPFWLSFAFWQWLAVAFLGIGIAHLVAAGEAGQGGVRSRQVSQARRSTSGTAGMR